jgi:hypothetical protein
VTVNAPSTLWTPLNGNFDYLADQQTGSPAGDIVGIGSDYGMFVTLDDNGAASSTDGQWGFRLRLDAAGGTKSRPAFDRVAWIAIDADINGSIDAYLGLNLQGNSSQIGIHAPGNSANDSPDMMSVNSTPFRSHGLTSSNYNYRPVDYRVDGGTTNDLTPSSGGDPDYYVSFMVPFADVVAFLETRSIRISDQTPMRFIPATSTQINKFNQDLGGTSGGAGVSTTWQELNAFTPVVNATGTLIPEPGAALLLTAGLACMLAMRRRR